MPGMMDFLKELQKDPGLIGKLQKREELDAFKKEFNTERATPLKCPACGAYLQYPGSLWVNKDDITLFVCRKCRLVFKLTCLTVPNETLIAELRRAVKGEGGLPSWIKKAEPTPNEEKEEHLAPD